VFKIVPKLPRLCPQPLYPRDANYKDVYKPYRAFQACIMDSPGDWRRRAGRPRQSWLRTVEADLRPMNLGLATAKRRAKDRSAWRLLVATATSPTSSWREIKTSAASWAGDGEEIASAAAAAADAASDDWWDAASATTELVLLAPLVRVSQQCLHTQTQTQTAINQCYRFSFFLHPALCLSVSLKSDSQKILG